MVRHEKRAAKVRVGPRLLALGWAACLSLGVSGSVGCRPGGGRLLVAPELMPAQATLSAFGKALGAWDKTAIDALIVAGGAHPAWRIQHDSLEGRGLRFADVKVGAVRKLTSSIAVGAMRFRLTGQGVADTDRLRMARVLVVRLPQGWRVSHWGTRAAVKRHLAWVAGGGEPSADPYFKKLVERYEAQKRALQSKPR